MRDALLPPTVLALLLLSGCGGSGDGAPTASAPTSVPAPTPTPTPPATSYDVASDFTRDRAFDAIGVRVVDDGAGRATESRLDAQDAAIGFAFTAATRTYAARYAGDRLTVATRSEPASAGGEPADVSEDGRFVRSVPVAGARHVGLVEWIDVTPATGGVRTPRTSRMLLFGARTVAADIPTAGTRTLAGTAATNRGDINQGDGTATLAIDYAARRVSGSAFYNRTPTGNAGSGGSPAETIVIDGLLDPATGRVTGAITLSARGATGAFEGALYGPAGNEVGLLFRMLTPDGTPFYGRIVVRA